MSNKIEKQKSGTFLRASKGNELIKSVNSLLDIKVVYEAGLSKPEVVYTDNDVVIKLPKQGS